MYPYPVSIPDYKPGTQSCRVPLHPPHPSPISTSQEPNTPCGTFTILCQLPQPLDWATQSHAPISAALLFPVCSAHSQCFLLSLFYFFLRSLGPNPACPPYERCSSSSYPACRCTLTLTEKWHLTKVGQQHLFPVCFIFIPGKTGSLPL